MCKRRGFTPVETKITHGAGRRFIRGFTLIELLVVIAIIALLVAILMPALARVKRQAKAVTCQAKLKQWGTIFALYANQNNGYFFAGIGYMGDDGSPWWGTLRQYYNNDPELRLCPMATKSELEVGVSAFSAWDFEDEYDDDDWKQLREPPYGSYGINSWAINPLEIYTSVWGHDAEDYWRGPYVTGAANIPLFSDCQNFAVWPYHSSWGGEPPEQDGIYGWTCMAGVCINRHDGYINSSFLDFSVRKVGLKELWTLKWHRTFDINGPWTAAGGVQPGDWPEWMKRFKDYD